MQAVQNGRRLTDRILMIPTWRRVCNDPTYVPSQEPSLNDTFGGHNYARTFAVILYQGLWLQRGVTERLPLTSPLAADLEAYAELGNNTYEDSQRERVAAAFLLWPLHSARYYGYSEATESERLKSRDALCHIQAILYNNVRTFLDILRLWFDCYDDANLRAYVVDSMVRGTWRPAKLTQNLPDLCAVDFLIEHLLEVMKARPSVRKAIQGIQRLSLGHEDAEDTCSTVLSAFKELRVAQMTVFYHPNPHEVRGQDHIPLYELVHETRDTNSLPEKLIPFGDDPLLAKNFRRLANTIYSVKARDKQSFRNFLSHRKSTLGQIQDSTSFISDGRTSNYFLSTRPPVGTSTNGTGNSNDGSDGSEDTLLWPFWYRQQLHDLDPSSDLPDWSDHFWWNAISRDELKELLFPGPLVPGELHKNDHMSAYWDELASRKIIVEHIEIPDQHPTGEPSFGYLMELLLRRERETRTSFFFALAQTYEPDNPRLCQFVGGTFLGLERPGIPFSKERFEALAARVRGLVMAVAHFSTTQALKLSRWKTEEERSNFDSRVKLIIRLLRGSKEDDDYRRDGHLLFATPVFADKTDHDYIPSQRLGWKPSRYQIKSVFTSATHLHELPKTSEFSGGSCSNTWKALFYLGGTAHTHNKLNRFLTNWTQRKDDDDAMPSDLADRAVTCRDCFGAALEFLISPDMYQALRNKINVTRKGIILPTRPGIRFLIAFCRFIVDVHSQASPENTNIDRIDFQPGSVILDFNKPKLISRIWERKKYATPNFVHTVGVFKLLELCLISPKKGRNLPNNRAAQGWTTFLNSPEFARPIQFDREENDRRLVLRWEI